MDWFAEMLNQCTVSGLLSQSPWLLPSVGSHSLGVRHLEAANGPAPAQVQPVSPWGAAPGSPGPGPSYERAAHISCHINALGLSFTHDQKSVRQQHGSKWLTWGFRIQLPDLHCEDVLSGVTNQKVKGFIPPWRGRTITNLQEGKKKTEICTNQTRPTKWLLSHFT